MPLRAIIVDDEHLARQELQYLLEDSGNVDILAVGTNGIEAVELIRTHHPDVVFLDVQMPGLDGFGVLKQLLDRRLTLPQIVFATAYDQYAVRAFEVNAVDYLLKPFDRLRVAKTIEKARARLTPTSPPAQAHQADQTAAKLDALLALISGSSLAATSAPRPFPPPAADPQHPALPGPHLVPPRPPNTGKVIVRASNRLLLIDQREICFATIDTGTITVATRTVEGLSNCRTLEELSDLLDPAAFWRAHRSYLVNIQHIREVVPWFKSTYQLRMDDPKKTEIPVSRNQTKRLRDLFNL